MRSFFSFVAALAWALWLGGLVALFLFVQQLFGESHELASNAAPVLFHSFVQYQLLLAAATLVATVGWRFGEPSGRITLLFAVFAIGALLSVYGANLVNVMEQLRAEHRMDEFRALHGRSMMLFVGQTALLFFGGIMLASAMRHRAPATQPDPTPATGAGEQKP